MELFLFQNGERIGPYTLDELQGWLDAGQVSSSDSVWFEGCEDWVTIREIPGIRISGMAGHAIDADLVPPFDAYQGDEPYIFVSYAHKDSAGVYEEIQRLHEAGYKIWYDEGIDAGNEWPEEIANAVIGCSLFLIFVTPRATESVNCRNEINMALNKGKPFLAIHLEETALPPGLELRMGDLQAILRYKLPQDRYQQKVGTMLDQLLGKTPVKSKKKAPAVQQPEPSNEIEPVARATRPDTSVSVRAPAKPRRRGLAIALMSVLLVACCIGGFLFFKSRSSSPQPTPGKPWTVPTGSIEMFWCKPGAFMMGSPENEKDRKVDETRHEVTFTKGFYLGKYEVTQAQWTEVMETNPSEFAGDDLPVEMVSWKDAMEFCEKLTEIERASGQIPDGWKYRLPTEAQWEYACRAGTTTVYAFGDKITTKQANFDKTLGKTTNIGKYPANAWGFHDMHGNIREWCLDWHNPFAKGSMRDPQGPADGSYRVGRGGCWDYDGRDVRSADRSRHAPDARGSDLGFRLSLQTETERTK
jgi:sulfatase modifying factor 1